MVSTSSCCVVTNEMVLCLGDLHAINHDEINRVLWFVFNEFIIICFIISQSCIMYQSCTINQCCTIFQSCTVFQSCTIVQSSNIIVFTSSNNIQFISFTKLHIQLNGASLQDNSLLRYTLYTSSVQDLHLPPRFLLQRQSYAFYQGNTLELSISSD